jgi:kinetochore protein Spc7/SPC105
MTGIKFMDEITAPRRSMHPHTVNHQARNPADIPLSEYYIAMGIDVPQLGLFTRVAKDLEGWMARSKADFAQAEEEAAKITPELFVEFMRADEEGQAELLVSFISLQKRMS